MRVILILTLAFLLLSVSAVSGSSAERLSVDGKKVSSYTGSEKSANRQSFVPFSSSGFPSRFVSLLIGRFAITRTPTILFVLIDSEKGERDEPYLDPPPNEGPWRTRIDLDEDPWEEQK